MTKIKSETTVSEYDEYGNIVSESTYVEYYPEVTEIDWSKVTKYNIGGYMTDAITGD